MEPSSRRRHPVLRGATAALAVAPGEHAARLVRRAAGGGRHGGVHHRRPRHHRVVRAGHRRRRRALLDRQRLRGRRRRVRARRPGRDQGTLQFRVEPVDVEAVAFHQGRLYVADIGDNRAVRDNVTVYFFDDAAAGDRTGGLQGVRLLLSGRTARRRDPAGRRRRAPVHRHQGDPGWDLRRTGLALPAGGQRARAGGRRTGLRDRRDRAPRRPVRAADLRLGRDRRPRLVRGRGPGRDPCPEAGRVDHHHVRRQGTC